MSDPGETPSDRSPARFAVVGRVNKGKSSVLATLVEEADNQRLRIGPTPGETTRCQTIPLTLNGETLVEFIDTPGFNQARQALAWLRAHHREEEGRARLEAVRQFVATFRDAEEFVDECRLLQPILDGAGIVYVVDASKPYRTDFVAEMEILRWTGRPRMAVMNFLSGDTSHAQEWREHLGEFFNLTRDFNAHTARFRERIRLLRHLLEIEDRHRGSIEKTIQLLESGWNRRREDAADIVINLLQRALTEKACKNASHEDTRRSHRRQQVEAKLQEEYRTQIRMLEGGQHARLSQLYRHPKAEMTHESGDAVVEGDDLFAEETWQVLGLAPMQLAVAATLAGGAAGAGVDLATGGATHGLGTVIGAAGGFIGALWKGRALAEIKIDHPLLGGGLNPGGVKLCAGPPKNPNFPWVLLDRALYHFEHLVTRAHGRRDRFVIDFADLTKAGEGSRQGYASRIGADERKVFGRWFDALSRGRAEAIGDREVFSALVQVLGRIETGELRVRSNGSLEEDC